MPIDDGEALDFLMRINEKLAEEVSFLRNQIRQLMGMNQQLIDKVTNKETKRAPVTDSDFSPIGGYTSLRQKIEDAEQDSKNQAAQAEKDQNAS